MISSRLQMTFAFFAVQAILSVAAYVYVWRYWPNAEGASAVA
jgi:hypothetical protein